VDSVGDLGHTELGDGPIGLGSRARIQQPRLTKAVYTMTEFESGRSFARAA
jgi:hypothetical protein